MLSHLDQKNRPAMVNVSAKDASSRVAKAQSVVVVPDNIVAEFSDGEIASKKGPVFQTAILAGTMAVKKTSDIIPLCHPLGIEGCHIDINMNELNEIVIVCTVTVHHKTGVEMEALVGASVAALTVYDMCKAMSHHIVIKETKLLEKCGGKNDFRYREEAL